MEIYFDFQDALQGVQRVRYSELISSTIIIYDHVITLGQEIELIWKAGWSFGKCLFLLNRYYTLFVVIFNNYVLFGPGVSTTLCVHWLRWQGITGILAFVFGELILQLRLAALYNLNRKVLSVMVCTFLMALVASSAVMGVVLSRINVLSIPVHLRGISTSICDITNMGSVSFFWSFWLPIMFSETLLCALVVIRAIGRMRESRRRRQVFTWAENGRELVMVLIRDSILYFLVLFAIYLTNTVLFLQNDLTIIEAAISYSVSFSCVMGSRLCLNVRGMVSASSNSRPFSSTARSGQQNVRLATSSSITSPKTPSGSQRWPAAIFSRAAIDCVNEERGELTEYEMRELRDMKPGSLTWGGSQREWI